MNVLMVYPRFPDTFWSFKHALRFIRKTAALPPLGLITVAAMLPPEWNKRLVDVNIRELTDADLAWADYVFISAMIVQRESAREIIARCKQAGRPVVAGGPMFTAEPELFPEVDHFVLNEAEVTLPRFLADLARGAPERMYRCDEFPDIECTPAPMWELLELDHYASMSVQYSRGCPYNCDFCNITTLFGHRPRVKSAQQMINELDGLYRLGWRGPIFFVDDNLIGNKRRLKQELLPALIEWRRGKVNMAFNTEASINLADDPQLMDLMVQAGFTTVFIGIETPDSESLAEANKRQNTRRDLAADIRRIQRAGLQVQGGFIIGFDNDTPSIFQRQIDFIQRTGVVTAMVGLLNALPGTRLYERLRQEGRLLTQTTGDNSDGTTNIVPMMDPEVLREGYRTVVRYIYAPRPYYQRVKTFLREYGQPVSKVPLDREHLMAFFRAAWQLGLLGAERVEYWRLLIWTALRRPRLVPIAVTLAIYGYHFRTVSQLNIR